MKCAVVCLNGFLRPSSNRDGIDPVAQDIYVSLKSRYRVVLLDETADRDTEHWLGVYGITGFTRAYTPPADFAPETVTDGRLRMLAAIRNADGADLVVEADPACAAAEIRAGYNVLLYASPHYLLDIWDPEHGDAPRPWDDIVSEIDRQRAAKAADTRLNTPDD